MKINTFLERKILSKQINPAYRRHWLAGSKKPPFPKKGEKRYANISDAAFDQKSLIHLEASFLGCDIHTYRQTSQNRPWGQYCKKLHLENSSILSSNSTEKLHN